MITGGDMILAGSSAGNPAATAAAVPLGMERLNGSRGLAALEPAREGRG